MGMIPSSGEKSLHSQNGMDKGKERNCPVLGITWKD